MYAFVVCVLAAEEVRGGGEEEEEGVNSSHFLSPHCFLCVVSLPRHSTGSERMKEERPQNPQCITPASTADRPGKKEAEMKEKEAE